MPSKSPAQVKGIVAGGVVFGMIWAVQAYGPLIAAYWDWPLFLGGVAIGIIMGR